MIGCHSSCYTCDGGSSTNCLSCSGSYLYLPPVGSCMASCPEGYYQNEDSMQCTQCFQGNEPIYYACATCSGGASNNCNSCNPGYFLHPNTEGVCLNPCPAGFWGDSSTKTCQPCYNNSLHTSIHSCKTCKVSESSRCLTCFNGTFLQPDNDRYCLSTCPSTYWRDVSSNKCITCNITCQRKLFLFFCLHYI